MFYTATPQPHSRYSIYCGLRSSARERWGRVFSMDRPDAKIPKAAE